MKNLTAARRIAIGAVRSAIRATGDNPKNVSVSGAFATLDDLYRTEPGLIACQWYREATSSTSNSQLSLFRTEWNKYLKS